MKTSPHIETPAQKMDKGPFSSNASSQLSSWLDALPVANPTVCAQKLLVALRESNRSPLVKMSRFQLAEQLRPATNAVCESLVKPHESAPLPLDAYPAYVSKTVVNLFDEVAISYKLSINELVDRPKLSSKDKSRLQQAIQRAILAHGDGLLETYRTYSPEPIAIWRAAHSLFKLAETLAIQDKPDDEETELSIKEAYLRMVVLATCNPYHLMQGEAAELYRQLGRLSHSVRLTTPEPSAPLDGQFIVDLDSDLPPRFTFMQQRLPTDINPRLLNYHELLKHIKTDIQNLNTVLDRQKNHADVADRLQRDMYTRIYNALAQRNERGSPRRTCVARLRIVHGLNACHYFLNNEREFEPKTHAAGWQKKLDTTSSGLTPGTLSLSNPDDYISHPSSIQTYRGGQDLNAGDIWTKVNRAKPPVLNEQQPLTFGPMIWGQKNQNAGGVALFCKSSSMTRTRVGELVAFMDSNAEQASKKWELGVIRWLRTHGEDGIEIGIRHLAKSSHAAGSKAVRGPGRSSKYLRTLVLPKVNPITKPTTLVTLAAVYDVGTILALKLGELLLYVELTELIETNSFFSHFRCRVCQEPTELQDKHSTP